MFLPWPSPCQVIRNDVPPSFPLSCFPPHRVVCRPKMTSFSHGKILYLLYLQLVHIYIINFFFCFLKKYLKYEVSLLGAQKYHVRLCDILKWNVRRFNISIHIETIAKDFPNLKFRGNIYHIWLYGGEEVLGVVYLHCLNYHRAN